MKIAINITPLKSGHKDRGIGFYTDNLVEYLKKDSEVTVREFTDLTKVKDVDVIHYPWFDLFFHTLPIKRDFPTVVTVHDVTPLIFPENFSIGIRGKLNFLLQKIALKSAKYVITDSLVSKKDISKILKLDNNRIYSIPLAPDNNFKILSQTTLLSTKRKYNLPDEFLLYVGDVNWVKNVQFLLYGLERIIKNTKFKNLKLILVGGSFLKKVDDIDHPELKSLKLINQYIQDHNLEMNIIRPGYLSIDELVAFYNLATAYVQPSFYEGFGFPLLEAFRCGTPVISSSGGSLQEVGGAAAVYFDPHNLNQFETITTEILENKPLQNKLSRLGLAQVEKFKWEKVIQDTKLVYRKAIEK